MDIISLSQFLSSKTVALMGIKMFGEFKVYFIEQFKGILDLTVRNADKARSSVPDWAKEWIKTDWNVEEV